MGLLYFSMISLGEFILLLLFLYTLATRGARIGRDQLLLLSMFIVILVISTFSSLYHYTITPVSPPPEMWEEAYYDSLAIRYTIITKGKIDGMIIFILILSYMYGIYREITKEEPKPLSEPIP